MSESNEPDAQSSTKAARFPGNLFDNKALSDVQIKLRDDQRIYGHKQILAQKSEWFYRAFNGEFPVATSGEICLDDEDDDPKAIRAMIQHIYDSDQTIYLSSPITELMYHVNVFAAADKYDVPSLRVLVVSRFTQLMEQKWSTNQQEFCTVIQCLCGLNAVRLADTSLQKAAAAFCSTNMLSLIKLDAFVSMLEKCGPFAARLLSAFLKNKRVINTFRCETCRSPARLIRTAHREETRCFTCKVCPSTRDIGDNESYKRYSILEL
ncbi:hypothetical protein E4T44_03528 [Aureobasidium sp. EXF-8845]|nr:hypothetical protein E4T44_03528 [Aureobasidium sp. EXF-8845]KAI4854328.1 hypothetical protein E4T45_04004 [Aureobasidium sp. EXF-8846]